MFSNFLFFGPRAVLIKISIVVKTEHLTIGAKLSIYQEYLIITIFNIFSLNINSYFAFQILINIFVIMCLLVKFMFSSNSSKYILNMAILKYFSTFL